MIPWFNHLSNIAANPVGFSHLFPHHYSSFPLQVNPISDLWYVGDLDPLGFPLPHYRLKYHRQSPETYNKKHVQNLPERDQERDDILDDSKEGPQFVVDETSYGTTNLEELFSGELHTHDNVDMEVRGEKGRISHPVPSKEKEILNFHISDFKPEEITVRLKGSHLHISGKHVSDLCEGNEKTCVTRQFHKSYRIPPKVDSQFMSAKLTRDGTLKVYSHLKDSEKLIQDIDQFGVEDISSEGEITAGQVTDRVKQEPSLKDKTEDLINVGDVYEDDDIKIEVTA